MRSLQERLEAENLHLRGEIERVRGYEGIVGESDAIHRVLSAIEKVAPTDAAVLVQGETGTGKELVVRAIHERSSRRDRPLVKVACAALPEGLVESELFGHERGAFTGATTARRGLFELADGGTIFFDDVDTLPEAAQAKLLRVLQGGDFHRVGGSRELRADVRVVSATNRDLETEAREGRFRKDLYFRLAVFPILIPPLRERMEDVPVLAELLTARESARLGRPIRAITSEALDALRAHHWPGNVRELRNVLERSIVMSEDELLRLPPSLGDGDGQPRPATALGSAPLAELLRGYKIELIRGALERTGGNRARAAELLGLHRPNLRRMIKDLGLEGPRRGGGDR